MESPCRLHETLKALKNTSKGRLKYNDTNVSQSVLFYQLIRTKYYLINIFKAYASIQIPITSILQMVLVEFHVL